MALRPVVCAACLCLAFGRGAEARQGAEKVAKGSEDVFIQKVMGEHRQLPQNYSATETRYFLYVPDGYDPRHGFALVLAISPGGEGRWMFQMWEAAAKKYPVIFACPEQAGNDVDVERRGQMVLDTLCDVRAKYNIDPEQIYVTGFSGGARMSTALVSGYPGLFAGHIPVGGVYFTQPESKITGLRTKLGHYLFAGEKDFNRKEAQRAFDALKAAGIPVELMVGEGQGHEPATAQQGLKIYEWFLARRPKTAAPALKEEKKRPEKTEPPPAAAVASAQPPAPPRPETPEDQARRMYQLAENLARNNMRGEARRVLEELARKFPGTRHAGLAQEKLNER